MGMVKLNNSWLEKYNGWTNIETWLIHLHLTNNQAIEEKVGTLIQKSNEKEDSLFKFVEDFLIIDSNKDADLLRMDLITTALSKVNWEEIVKSFGEALVK